MRLLREEDEEYLELIDLESVYNVQYRCKR